MAARKIAKNIAPTTKSSADQEPLRFEGFDDAARSFFKKLEKNNNRDWFLAHKEQFDELWGQPFTALMREVAAAADALYPDCDLEEPKVFRMNRDVRFSKDKSPYKTEVSGILSIKRMARITEAPAALYIHLGLDTVVAGGMYIMSSDAISRFRSAIADGTRGKELQKIVASLEKKGHTVSAHESLKKVPKGYEPDHPRARFLVMKGLMASAALPSAKVLASRELFTWLKGICRDFAPLVRWLNFNTV